MDFFSALPEGCVSHILSLTSPRDVCRLSAISKGFESAADSDAVWGGFLPSDHRKILSRSVSPVGFSTNKQLYFRLADHHVLLDDGNLSFALEKESGKKCFMVGARELAFAWGSTPRYWRWISLPQFSEVAKLLPVFSFEIMGEIDTQLLTQGTTYIAYLVFKIACRNFALESLPFMASIVLCSKCGDWMGNRVTNTVYFTEGKSGPDLSAQNERLACTREDGWMEVELGEFFNCYAYPDDEVEMHVKAIEREHCMYGLIVEGIELRPKVDG
ncbi:hypothetical protein RHSIM_Rhsim05G0174300 [Rhododendron simsii]|uniref:F-box domain-containing protein n=1 Tax=Rhododendron simsii TaxID=118357 RepID=A0A834LPD5_RHOSS|nr:hypothetical protein RHSIM_Rhsim05G0174300 [Rhododendron simsii]